MPACALPCYTAGQVFCRDRWTVTTPRRNQDGELLTIGDGTRTEENWGAPCLQNPPTHRHIHWQWHWDRGRTKLTGFAVTQWIHLDKELNQKTGYSPHCGNFSYCLHWSVRSENWVVSLISDLILFLFISFPCVPIWYYIVGFWKGDLKLKHSWLSKLKG